MHMIVCDVEGCDAVEKHNGHIGLGSMLPAGWKTVQMTVSPSQEEIDEIEAEQKRIEAMMSAPTMAPNAGMGYMMPAIADRMCTFVICDKHEVPKMKAEAAASNEFLGGVIPAVRRRPVVKAH